MLWERDGLTQKEIAKELKLKPSTVTVMLKRMERAGFLKRETDLQDMRVSRVYLTEKGKIIKKDVEDINLILENDCFSGFTLEEKILLRRFFLQILDNLQKVNKRENAYDKRCL
jgi:DNA-binding MarR family transcriptional regulator